MKRLKKYCSIVFLISVFACGDPSPTELIYNDTPVSEDIDIEIISPRPDEIVYASGYDSTGIVQPIPNHLSNIYVSGIKNTINQEVKNISYFSAIFFDENHPINNPHGKRLGYRTKNNFGKVYFNNIEAIEVPHIIRIMEMGQIRDEIAGMKYVLSNRNIVNQFPFDSSILFTVLPMSMPMQGRKNEFEIPTPKEITGQVLRSGSRNSGDLKLTLKWNNPGEGIIEIIVGGMEIGKPDPFPLLRIRTKDDGELIIPPSIVKSIPFQKFNEIVFSFIRQKIKNDSSLSGLNDPNVIAQSIHNIRVVIQ